MEFPVHTLVGFLLALVRVTAWMSVCPPFNTRMIPRLVKLGCAAGIAMCVAPQLPAEQMTTNTFDLLGMILMQVATGLALGFLTNLMFSAIQAAGAIIDLFGGFSMSMSMDPFGTSQTSVFGRVYQLLAITLLFAINGHLLLIKGFMTTFEVVPLGGIVLESFKEVLLRDVTMFAVAALEIAAPLVAAFFLTEVALGLLSKAAPQLNVLTFGFPLKILLTMLMVAGAAPLLPGAVESLINHSLRDGIAILQATGEVGS